MNERKKRTSKRMVLKVAALSGGCLIGSALPGCSSPPWPVGSVVGFYAGDVVIQDGGADASVTDSGAHDGVVGLFVDVGLHDGGADADVTDGGARDGAVARDIGPDSDVQDGDAGAGHFGLSVRDAGPEGGAD